MNLFLLTFLSLNKFYILKNDSLKAWNAITLKPLNPNVSLESNTVKRKLFPTDDKLIEMIKSDAFKHLLQTDASTEDGQKYVANYYGVTKQWEQLIAKDTECTNTASTYYQLLRTVKCLSKKDNVWILIYEGLHQHSALMLSLLSSTFNMTTSSNTNR